MELCFATNNQHKLREVRQLLDGQYRVLGLADIGCTEELREDQDTLEDNSLQKAKYIFDHYNISCFADDTGLEVDALQGAPGVYSARYAGAQRNDEDNINLLLKNLEQSANRKARFRTIITLVITGTVHQFEGIAHGEILTSKRGEHGFGYDPVFLPEGHQKSMAELTAAEKNAVSHRGRAMKKLVAFLKNQ
ncbi:MAG TPA: non-canonical purine NTP diphosphatase [Cyclobacteriaceae bacterium]